MTKLAPLALFALAFAVRSSFPHVRPYTGIESLNLARSVAFNGRFADPFLAAPTGPTAHLPPVFPWLAAVVYRAAGVSAAERLIPQLNLLLVCMAAPVLWWSVKSITGNEIASLLAGSLIAAIPLAPSFECGPVWDAPLLALMLIALSTATLLYPHRTVWLGIGWGLAFLTGTVAPAALFGLTILVALFQRERLRSLAVVCAIAVLVTVPWAVRNSIALGSPTWVRSNLGMELYVSNSDCASPTVKGQGPCLAALHPNYNPAAAAELARVREARFNEDRLARAKAWIAAHPRRFAQLCAGRMFRFWFPLQSTGRRLAYAVNALTLLSFAGLFFLWRDHRPLAMVLAACWLFCPAIYYLVQTSTRYRFPIWWTTVMAAAWGMHSLSAAARDALPGLRARLRPPTYSGVPWSWSQAHDHRCSQGSERP